MERIAPDRQSGGNGNFDFAARPAPFWTWGVEQAMIAPKAAVPGGQL
jgi:hypothetical protein